MQSSIKFAVLFSLGTMFTPFSTVSAHSHNTYIYVDTAPAPVVAGTVEVGTIPEVIVDTSPPTEIVESMTVSPGPEYVWMKGYWKWEGHWVWVSGHWHHRPHAHAEWTSGYWHERHGHWVWAEGRWQ